MIVLGTIAPEEAEKTAVLVRDAFAPVARLFGLTAENCPTHPSLATAETIARSIARGTRFLSAREETGRLVGVVGIRAASDGVVALEKLSVLPEIQGRGVGGRLLDRARNTTGRATLEASIIDDHSALASWYERRGFSPTHVVRPKGLPFSVRILIYPGDDGLP